MVQPIDMEKQMTIPKSNQYQVGGSHYKAEYQHWDWAEDIGLGYLEGAGSAYVLRWQSKGGVEDLKKAIHFVEKLIEIKRCNRAIHLVSGEMDGVLGNKVFDLTQKMCDQVNLPIRERAIMHEFADWQDHKDLRDVISLIEDIIQINEGHPEIQDHEGQDENQS